MNVQPLYIVLVKIHILETLIDVFLQFHVDISVEKLTDTHRRSD